MSLDKQHHYVYRIGSDNQHRLHWDGSSWHYEFLAGGVLFDQLICKSESELEDVVSVHGLHLNKFVIDFEKESANFSRETQEKMKRLIDAGIDPCQKHGLTAKNMDNTCEACANTDYPDDFKGQEG